METSITTKALRELEMKLHENNLLMEEMVAGLNQELSWSKYTIEQALYRASVSTGQPPLQIALLIHEFFACIQDIGRERHQLVTAPLDPQQVPEEQGQEEKDMIK